MKPKYKLDQFIQYKRNGTSEHGTITGVIKRNSGVFYELADNEENVGENDVILAYRAVTPRKTAAKKPASKKSSKKTAPAQEQEINAA